MAPVIVLDSTYSLTADLHQWIILENGRMFKFFQNLENAIDWVFKAKIKGCNVKSIEQLSFTIKRHSEALCTLVTTSEFQEQIKNLRSELK